MIEELTMYWLYAGVLGTATLVFTLWLLRNPSRRYPYLAPIVFSVAVTTLAYVAMANEFLTFTGLHGRDVPTARWAGYIVSYILLAVYIGVTAGASRRLMVAVSMLIVLMQVLVPGAFFLHDPWSTICYVLAVLTLLAIGYLFFFPLDRASQQQPGELALLFGKLRNFGFVLWFVLLIMGALTRHGAGVLDAFTGIFMAAYIEVIIATGFAAITFRSPKAVDCLARRTRSPVRWVTGIQREPADPDPS